MFIVSLVDADSCDRSVPTLGNILTSVYGHPISPLVYASRNGESIVIETPDPQDTGLMELLVAALWSVMTTFSSDIARHLSQKPNAENAS